MAYRLIKKLFTTIISRTSSRNSSLTSNCTSPQVNPKLPLSIQLHPPDNIPSYVANEKSLSAQGYLALKMKAIKEIMESTTNGLVIIMQAKDNAVNNLQNNYDKIIFDWDKTKNDLDTETKIAIMDLTNAMHETRQISITHRTIRSEIDEIRITIDELGNNIDDVIEKMTSTAAKMTNNAVDTSMKKVIHNINSHSDTYIQNMEDMFSENMVLVHDQHTLYNITQLCTDTKIAALGGIDETVSEKAKTAISQIQDNATTIINSIKTMILSDNTINYTWDGILSDTT